MNDLIKYSGWFFETCPGSGYIVGKLQLGQLRIDLDESFRNLKFKSPEDKIKYIKGFLNQNCLVKICQDPTGFNYPRINEVKTIGMLCSLPTRFFKF